MPLYVDNGSGAVGPVGPEGPEGPAGPEGPPGEAGLLSVAHVFVSGDYTVPAGVTHIVVEVVAGGGGGLGYESAGIENGCGAGGGAGGYNRTMIPVVPAQVYACVIGASGAGGAGSTPGGNGGDSTFIGNGQTVYCEGGFAASVPMSDLQTTEFRPGGRGGTSGPAALGHVSALPGPAGATALRVALAVAANAVVSPGIGGSTPLGTGGGWSPGGGHGQDGGFGAGGQGGQAVAGGTANGGAGGVGLVIVWEYA